jgi:pyruvate,water dikinase
MTYVSRLDSVSRDDLAAAGGKGANLGELIRAGLPVPPGFLITTKAYREHLEVHGLVADIKRIADLRGSAAPAAYAEAGEQIRGLITAATVSEPIQREIRAAYAALGGGAVAVRSSATAEDLAEASFAGQQDTYLNVRGPDALITAVQRCWASLWTDRAMVYRSRQGIDLAGLSLAVVVQRMVEAEAAGVMFTANPTNGRRDETGRRPRAAGLMHRARRRAT